MRSLSVSIITIALVMSACTSPGDDGSDATAAETDLGPCAPLTGTVNPAPPERLLTGPVLWVAVATVDFVAAVESAALDGGRLVLDLSTASRVGGDRQLWPNQMSMDTHWSENLQGFDSEVVLLAARNRLELPDLERMVATTPEGSLTVWNQCGPDSSARLLNDWLVGTPDRLAALVSVLEADTLEEDLTTFLEGPPPTPWIEVAPELRTLEAADVPDEAFDGLVRVLLSIEQSASARQSRGAVCGFIPDRGWSTCTSPQTGRKMQPSLFVEPGDVLELWYFTSEVVLAEPDALMCVLETDDRLRYDIAFEVDYTDALAAVEGLSVPSSGRRPKGASFSRSPEGAGVSRTQ